MNILSWNLGLTSYWLRYYCMGLTYNIEQSITDICQKLLKFNSDFIFLQEVNYGFETINNKIKHIYPYYYYIESIGIVIFGKLKIQPISFTNSKKDWFNYLFGYNNGFMICYVPKYDIYLCNTHLSCGFHLFNKFNELNTYISSIKELDNKNIIFGGDLNLTKKQFNYFCKINKLKSEPKNKNNISYHHIHKINLDYLLLKSKNNNIKEIEVKILKTYESDHYPILMEQIKSKL